MTGHHAGLKLLDDALMDQLRDQARASPRRRAVHRFHEHEEPVQRMLNALEPDSYVRPHKHEDPDKFEAFVVLRGRAAVVLFDPDGKVAATVVIAARGTTRGVEIPPRAFHCLVAVEAGTVLFELSQGPYDGATHKRWAPWAPEEGTPEGAAYLADLRVKLGL
ncbi:MAG: WbuC family cupin fold metalloprotein [Candidatus Sericytochromatia bacterium]|nr:WbuC family cupin fold metalloprotein [Candidatus Tanganyikabacteria bacterium]